MLPVLSCACESRPPFSPPSTLDPEQSRGFALADDLAPPVFINGADPGDSQLLGDGTEV